MRAAASRTFWTAGRSRPIRIAMMAMTTSSSISVKAQRGRGDGRTRTILSAGTGKGYGFGRVGGTPSLVKGREGHPVARGRSTGTTPDRQVFWLTALG